MPQSEDVLSASCLQWAPTHLLQTVELASSVTLFLSKC